MTTAPIAPVSYDYISNYECIHDVFQKIADENNLTYLDFNLVNPKEHILTNDKFRDDAHLNDSGVKIETTIDKIRSSFHPRINKLCHIEPQAAKELDGWNL